MKDRHTKSSSRKPNLAKSASNRKKKLRVEQIRPVSVYTISIIFILLCTVGVLAPSNTNYSDFYRDAIAEIGAVALLVYWLYNNRKVQDITLTIDATRVFLIALLIFASLSIFWTENIAFFVSKYVLWLGVAGILLLALTLTHNTKTYIILARVLVFIATWVSVIGLIQSLFSVDIFIQTKPPAATFVNKNITAQVLVLIFPLSLFLLLADSNKQISKLAPYTMALIFAYIFHTNTRAAWLGIGLEILLIIVGVIWQRKQLKEIIKTQNIHVGLKKSLHLMGAIILLLVLINISAQGWTFFGTKIADNADNIYSRFQSYGDVSEAGRYILWDASIEMIKQSPFIGSGMGSFFHNMMAHAERYHQYEILRAHNDLLELAVELGVVGWILFSGVIIGLLTALYKIMTRAEAEHRLFYLLIATGLAGSALNMQFSFPYQMPVPLMLFGLYVGCIIKAGDAYSTKIKTLKLTLNSWHWNASISFVGLILVSVIMVNFIWLNATAKLTDNLNRNRWPNNLVNNPLVCHRVLVKSFVDSSISYDQNPDIVVAILESLNKCIPNTWSYHSNKAVNSLRLGKYNEGISLLKLAKQHAPKGVYSDYVNEVIAYNTINDDEGALKSYRELIAQPIELLRKKPKILQQIIKLSILMKQREQAENFYRIYHQHYRGKKFLTSIKKYFPE